MDTLAPAPVVEQPERLSHMRSAAAAALHWPLNLWLESLLWVCLALSLGVSYTVSYTSLAAVAGAFGYGSWERWLAPLAIDVPLAASVLGQLLAARWRSPWWVKALLLLSLATAPLTLTGNALNGAVANGAFHFDRVDWPHLVAFGVPGGCVVLVALVTSIMLGQRASLAEQAITTARRRQSAPTARPGRRSKRRARSTSARPSLDGVGARGQLQELLSERPAITAGEAAPLIERSPSYTRALLAELRSGG